MAKAQADNPSVAEYLDNLDSPNKDLLLKVRSLVLDLDSQLTEDIKWRNSLVFISNGKNMIQTVVGKQHITFIFFNGVDLDDPQKILEGDGKKNLSVRVSDWESLHKDAFSALVQEAIAQRA